MKYHSAKPNGFTLIEVLVALVIGAILLLSARSLLVQLAAGAESIAADGTDSDRQANGDHLLRKLFGRLDSSAGSLSGMPTEMSFATWCNSSAGWLEQCEVRVSLQETATTKVVLIELPTGEEIEVGAAYESGQIRYLSAPDHGGSWLPVWESLITTPLAVALILDADTLIFRIGERG